MTKFSFTVEDQYEELEPALQEYMPHFVEHRIKELEGFDRAVNDLDFQAIREYCHKQEGIAASYKCYRLEEMAKFIHKFAKLEEIGPIIEVLPTLKEYFSVMQKRFS